MIPFDYPLIRYDFGSRGLSRNLAKEESLEGTQLLSEAIHQFSFVTRSKSLAPGGCPRFHGGVRPARPRLRTGQRRCVRGRKPTAQRRPHRLLHTGRRRIGAPQAHTPEFTNVRSLWAISLLLYCPPMASVIHHEYCITNF
jgi:hypothetical protein